jgi:TatD DNase family protein
MAELVDTHCHLNLAEHFPDPAGEIGRAREAGVAKLLIVGIDEPSNRRAVDLAERHEGVFAIVGWHPNSAAEYGEAQFRLVQELAQHPRTVAIGEIGLDYHWDFASKEQQERCLIDQLDLARSLGKPVVFHCRKAYPDLLTLLEARQAWPYLFHCFSGDAADLTRTAALDGYFGVDGPITYKKAHALRELVRSMPRDRVVLETDSPYLSPEPFRGRPNSPAYIPLINNALAASLGIDSEACADITTANACRFFRI